LPVELLDFTYVASAEALMVAELTRDRLHAALPRLQQKLGEAQSREYAARWESDYRQAEALRDAAAQRFARYPALVHELIEIILEAQAVDAEVSRVNGSALPGEHRRLQSVELKARGLKNFSISNPSVVDMVRLADWQHSERMAWPPHPPSVHLPSRVRSVLRRLPLPYGG
jgi:hypothetical protein